MFDTFPAVRFDMFDRFPAVRFPKISVEFTKTSASGCASMVALMSQFSTTLLPLPTCTKALPTWPAKIVMFAPVAAMKMLVLLGSPVKFFTVKLLPLSANKASVTLSTTTLAPPVTATSASVTGTTRRAELAASGQWKPCLRARSSMPSNRVRPKVMGVTVDCTVQPRLRPSAATSTLACVAASVTTSTVMGALTCRRSKASRSLAAASASETKKRKQAIAPFPGSFLNPSSCRST
mmetsp:Transcript_98637/g.234966  ORF Transcript_98637/g.234966 Transcript_98637/m.234966 type:complete len:236 (+) Transcript_98637:313-1020(+)